jgi:hypothetical protein
MLTNDVTSENCKKKSGNWVNGHSNLKPLGLGAIPNNENLIWWVAPYS